MSCHLLYTFFNNSSVAGLVTISAGAFVGVYTFWRQRRQTKIENLSEQIELLVSKCEEVNLSLDRISNTYILALANKVSRPATDTLLEGFKNEISIISEVVNNDISKIRAKIKNYTGFYFSDNKVVIDKMTSFFEELKSWHTNVIDIAHSGYDFKVRVSNNEKFSLVGIQDSAKAFFDSIK